MPLTRRKTLNVALTFPSAIGPVLCSSVPPITPLGPLVLGAKDETLKLPLLLLTPNPPPCHPSNPWQGLINVRKITSWGAAGVHPCCFEEASPALVNPCWCLPNDVAIARQSVMSETKVEIEARVPAPAFSAPLPCVTSSSPSPPCHHNRSPPGNCLLCWH